MDYKTGDVVLFRKEASDFYSKWIARFTGSSYTHVGIISTVNDNIVRIAEAQAVGFVFRTFDKNTFDVMVNDDRLLIRRSREKLNNIKETILKYKGRPYGFLDILLIAIHALTGKIFYEGSAKTLICSEAVARVLYDASNKKINFEQEFSIPYSYVTPDDIFNSKQLKTIK